MRKIFFAMILMLPGLAMAQTAKTQTPQTQTPQTATPQTLADQVIEEGLIEARPSRDTPLVKPLKVYPVELDFDAVRDLPVGVSTRGVKIRGFSRFVEVEGKKIGQLVVSHLEKGEKTAALDSQVFSAQFDLKDNELKPSVSLEIKGDREALIAALKELETQEETTEEEAEEAKSPPREPGAVAGGGSENTQAAGYETPDRLENKKEPTEESRITTEGCSVRLDFAREQAIQQSRLQTFKDGVLSEEGECSDSSQSYPLKKSYQLCKDKVDMDARKVTAQFQWFYNDQSQQYVKASQCQPDPDKVYPITEKHGVCPIDINIDAEKATPRSKLVYLGLNGVETIVRDCAPSEEKPAVALKLDTASCPLKHDFGAGVSKEMGLWFYQLEGQLFQATPCMATGVDYAHHRIYKKGGNNICPPIVDLASNKVTLQSRKEITIEGQRQYITECTPDEGGGLAIKGTTAGCEDPSTFKHDMASGVSYGKKRFYYENPDRVYVTDCQTADDLSYQHVHKIEGWQNHDDLKAAYPLTTVSITPKGTSYVIAKTVVLPGETLVPYDFDHTENRVVKNIYNGCSVTRETAKVEVYKRPDKTQYEQRIASGDPIGPLNACKSLVKAPFWKLIRDSGTYVYLGKWDEYKAGTSKHCSQASKEQERCTTSSVYHRQHYYERKGSYRGERIVAREDGTPITQKSKATHSITCNMKQVRNYAYKYRNPPQGDSFPAKASDPACPVTTYVSGWNEAEGW